MNLIALTSFFGILGGLLLNKIAKEEIKLGKKYFNFIIRICLVIISLILMYNFKASWTVLLGMILAYFIGFNYLFFGLSCVILDNFLLYVVIFIYGLPYGTILGNNKKILNELILFLIPLILLYNGLNITYGTEIASIIVGFLLMKAIKWK